MNNIMEIAISLYLSIGLLLAIFGTIVLPKLGIPLLTGFRFIKMFFVVILFYPFLMVVNHKKAKNMFNREG